MMGNNYRKYTLVLLIITLAILIVPFQMDDIPQHDSTSLGPTNESDDQPSMTLNSNGKGAGLSLGTYLGGSEKEYVTDMAIGPDGSIYVTGFTESDDFPTTAGAFDTTFNGTNEAFLSKLNANGTDLVYSTFLGGSDDEWSQGLSLADDGSVYLVGSTRSSDFPLTSDAYDNTLGGGLDIFIARISADGSSLLYSTFIGGYSSSESPRDIWVDGNGVVYVTGRISSTRFPTTVGAFDRTQNGYGDAFLLKFNITANALVYSTFIGGSGDDEAVSIFVDSKGYAYITGTTYSTDFPTTTGAYQEWKSTTWNSVFVVKMSQNGSLLDYSTHIGRATSSEAEQITVDGNGYAYIIGTTYGGLNVSSTAFDKTHNGNEDAFLLKLDKDASNLVYCTYVGSDGYDNGLDIEVDDEGCLYASGWQSGRTFPTTEGAYDTSGSGFILKLNSTGTGLHYSTLMGIGGFSIKIDPTKGLITVAGVGGDNETTTPGAYDADHDGKGDAFVFQLDIYKPSILSIEAPDGATTGDPLEFNVTMSDNIEISNVTIEYWNGNEQNEQMAPLTLIEGTAKTGKWHVTVNASMTTIADLSYLFHGYDIYANYNVSSIRTMEVKDNDLPEMIDVSSPDGTTGELYRFRMNATDNINVSEVRVEFWYGNNGEPLNLTLDLISGDRWGHDTWIPTNSTDTLHYLFYVVDNSSNVNVTDVRDVIVRDNDRPIFVKDSTDTFATTGETFTFRINVSDNIGISNIHVLIWWGPHEPTNVTLTTQDYGNWTHDITVPPTSLEPILYRFEAMDEAGNWNKTQMVTIEPVDNDTPRIGEDLTATNATTGDDLTFSILVVDNVGIADVVVIFSYEDGLTTNLDLIQDEDSHWNATIIIEHTLEVLQYMIKARDTSGNVNATVNRTVVVLDNDQPEIVDIQTNITATTGDPFHFKVRASDNLGVEGVRVLYILATIDYRILHLQQGADGSWEGTVIVEHIVTNIYYKVEAWDGSDNLNTTPTLNATVIDNDYPTISHEQEVTNVLRGLAVTLEFEVDDNIGVDELVLLFHFGIGPTTVKSLEISERSVVIDIPRHPSGPLGYSFEVQDAAGNAAFTEEYQIDTSNQVPIVEELPTWNVFEETDEEFDLAPYVSDPNDEILTVTCQDPFITVENMVLKVRHNVAVPDRTVILTVLDAEDQTVIELTIHVVNVNDGPVIESVFPKNGTTFKEGERVTFLIEHSDEEQDELTVSWIEGGKIFGVGDTIDYRGLKPGERVITVVVDDGTDQTEETITLVIKKEEESPGPGLVAALAALVLAGLVMVRRKGYAPSSSTMPSPSSRRHRPSPAPKPPPGW